MDYFFNMVTTQFPLLILFVGGIFEIREENYLGAIAFALLGILAGIMIVINFYLKEEYNE